MNTSRERAAEEMPDTITFAVLTVDGRLRIDTAPSNPEFRERTLYHNGPWDAITEVIGGPCRTMARTPIGKGLMAWVSDESLLRPDAYPSNEIGGRTINILAQFALESFYGDRFDGIEFQREWGGTIVITSIEDRGDDRWCGFIWPLDEEEEWLITQAHLAAIGDDSSVLYIDDLEIDDEPEDVVLRWERSETYKTMWTAIGPNGDWWCVVNAPWEKGDPPGPWTLTRRRAETLRRTAAEGDLVIEGDFRTLGDALRAGEEKAALEGRG